MTERSNGDDRRAGDTEKYIEKVLDILGISEWVSYSSVISNALFLCFLLGLGVIYVANTHLAERTIRKINHMEKDLKEQRWEYMTIKSNLMYERKQSELAEKLEEAGIRELKEPPHKIVVKKRAY
jgi:predicted transcriptional regulator YheO